MTGQKSSVREIALLFLKLGTIGFGGPAVHIAMMHDEVVVKRKWLTNEYFLDLIGATNLIPGPNSTEMAMHCGHERAGVKGLITAGICFIIPAALITGTIAYLYQSYGNLPEVQPYIYGIPPAILAIIAGALLQLGKTAVKNNSLAVLGLIAFISCLVGVNEIIALFGVGFLGVAVNIIRTPRSLSAVVPFMVLPNLEIPATTVFLIFLKIGAILYGSGYVLFALLDAELVQMGLLTRQQLIDAIAVGQMTPGPVFSAATFVGWQLGGLWGAAAATGGIFLPSFIFVGLLNPIIPKLRRSNVMSSFLDAVNVASIGVIASVLYSMGLLVLDDWRTITIAIASIAVLLRFRTMNSVVIVLGGACTGYLLLMV